MRKLISIAFLLFISGIAWHSPSVGEASEQPCVGHATPEKAHAAYVEAVQSDNWDLALSYVDSSARGYVFQDTIIHLIVAAALSFTETQNDELSAILKSHGLKVNEDGQYLYGEDDRFPDIRNWPMLMSQLSDFLRVHFGRSFADNNIGLTDIQIDGDKAIGKFKNSDKRIAFLKSDSGWCLTATKQASQD